MTPMLGGIFAVGAMRERWVAQSSVQVSGFG